ncbi:MAG: putative thiol oxidoreductase [Bryobacterales bacterium]|nr:putative thiol oxidoreductase [Bryobacterales bacterium]
MKIAALALPLLTVISLAQEPVFRPEVNIEQDRLLKGEYPLKKVLESGGDFYTTPFQPYVPKTQKGDGYGEGNNGVDGQADGPRASQRHQFNPSNLKYPFLRLNGLDSQSCYECHNSIGSSKEFVGSPEDLPQALIRKPFPVGGAAGSNSNAFINPLFPSPLTLFIRNPPLVFGTGYTQTLANEITIQLHLARLKIRQAARNTPGVAVAQPLVVNGLSFGTFRTTYQKGQPAKITALATCPAAAANPTFIGGAQEFHDDVTQVTGVNCDLVIRAFQWKGVSSSVRHFVRDALDFHFSMQAFEKVAFCDCDRDGKGTPSSGPEVSIGNVTAITAFVTMMRPPVQMIPPGKEAVVKLGESIFMGTASGLSLPKNMCTDCHLAKQTIRGDLNVHIEAPTQAAANSAGTNNEDQLIDPKNPATWPISPAQCRQGIPNNAQSCPVESSYGSSQNNGALVTPVRRSTSLAVVRRFNRSASTLDPAADPLTQLRRLTQAVLPGDYLIPLNPPPATVTPYQLNRLPVSKDGSIDVPLFSDLRTHGMGPCLSDPTKTAAGKSLPSQGTDVADVNTVANQFLTRALWGVADAGPWLHDGRATTLRDAVLQHGNSVTCPGSEANKVVDAFERLTAAQQDAVVQFLLTLRLPVPAGTPTLAAGK